MIESLRNIAIIAHVDHGKTTLVDCLLQQSGTLDRRSAGAERIMDSNDQERERGITILAKNTAIRYGDYRINIVDTPGHADFGGEVERVLSMVDSVLLLVDAVDGPMPQTRFVTAKAFARGLRPIVVVNKVDRPGARPDWVVDQVFDLFDNLGATEEQLDFPIVFASAIQGIAGLDHEAMAEDMTPLFDAIIREVPSPKVDERGPLQLQVSALDYNSYVGVIGVGRITRGRLKSNTQVAVVDSEGGQRSGRVLQVMGYLGLERVEVAEASAGDIVCVTGIDGLNIADEIEHLETKSRALTEQIFSSLTPWQISQLSRHPLRPYFLDYVDRIFDGFQELHGDRAFADDRAIVGGLARAQREREEEERKEAAERGHQASAEGSSASRWPWNWPIAVRRFV